MYVPPRERSSRSRLQTLFSRVRWLEGSTGERSWFERKWMRRDTSGRQRSLNRCIRSWTELLWRPSNSGFLNLRCVTEKRSAPSPHYLFISALEYCPAPSDCAFALAGRRLDTLGRMRSEERRVGKE